MSGAFVFKQKTACELRISDRSSDVCSSDLAVQARAPMTPVVKLVCGMDYDKTRLTEFAAALSYAARNDVKPGHLQALLEGYEGGLKGVVAAERAMRRPAESGRLAHSIEARQWQIGRASGRERVCKYV